MDYWNNMGPRSVACMPNPNMIRGIISGSRGMLYKVRHGRGPVPHARATQATAARSAAPAETREPHRDRQAFISSEYSDVSPTSNNVQHICVRPTLPGLIGRPWCAAARPPCTDRVVPITSRHASTSGLFTLIFFLDPLARGSIPCMDTAASASSNGDVCSRVQAGALLLGGAVHGGHVRGVRAEGGAPAHRRDRHHHAVGAALARARHRDRRHLQHDVRHLRRRHRLQGGQYYLKASYYFISFLLAPALPQLPPLGDLPPDS